jgi:ketosteroid isomerase-like protein
MSDLDDFLAEVLPRQLTAVEALHNGDPQPQLALSSTQDPVTLFGAAGMSKRGWDEVSRSFHWLASRFSDCTAQRFDLVAAGISGDLAYTVGFEHTAHARDGGPDEPYTLRVTYIYRREHGEWKIAHRHADRPPLDQRPTVEASKPVGSTGSEINIRSTIYVSTHTQAAVGLGITWSSARSAGRTWRAEPSRVAQRSRSTSSSRQLMGRGIDDLH